LIVDDEEIHDLNREYRNVDSPTDVLSFPMSEGEFGDIAPEMLGDVVISAPTADMMSLAHDCPLEAILDLLLAHGILHLLGYDHEQSEEEALAMEEKALELLQMLGHPAEDFRWYHH
jgi:probable rRNA maturation factor